MTLPTGRTYLQFRFSLRQWDLYWICWIL